VCWNKISPLRFSKENMKFKYCCFYIGLFLLASCTEFKKGEGDMLFKIADDKNGQEMKDFCFFTATYQLETENGRILKHTGYFDSKPAYMYKNQAVFKGDLNTALSHLSEGDSAVIKINADSLNRYAGYTNEKEDNSRYVIYKIRIGKVISRDGLDDSAFGKRIEEFKASQITHQGTIENQKIETYVKVDGQRYINTPTGLYLPERLGLTAKHRPGDSVKVNYTITSLDNEVFETNDGARAKKAGIYHSKRPYTPLTIAIEQLPSSGFKEAVKLIPNGGKAKVIIPSKLAYGSRGTKAIASYTPLVCEFEVLN
jgi:FKBP-type peptidyl-prolyl cis-trans isomerase FkpA